MTDKYRFDDAYEAVYEFNKAANAYIHIGSFLAFNIDSDDSEQDMIAKVESFPNYNLIQNLGE